MTLEEAILETEKLCTTFNPLISTRMSKLKFYLLFTLLFYSCWSVSESNAQTWAMNKTSSTQAENEQDSQVSIIEALNELSQTYEVFFTYNTARLKTYQVSTEYRQAKDVNSSLKKLLEKSNLRFKKRGKNNFVIVEKATQPIGRLLNDFPSPPPVTPQIPQLSDALEKTITGTVTDLSTGETLPGVNILVKGTSIGTITDVEGNYRLTAPDDAETLVFSSVGYTTEEVAIGDQTVINLEMAPDIQSLSEIVVVGYGTQKKKDLTGAVAVVESAVIENRQSVQLSDALQGSLPGVTVTRGNGAPGATSSVRVRGITSLNTNDPLVIVDGVPGIGLNDINPNDVENISVLKDAASQAIYGSRAAAGVILVTTKRAKSNTLDVSYDYEFGVSSPTTLPDFADAQTYRTIANERSRNDGGGIVWDSLQNVNYAQLNADSSDYYPNTNWQDEMLNNRNTTRQRHNLAVGYGTDRVKTRGSLSYVTEDGLYTHRRYDRFTFRLNNNIKISDIVSTTIDLGYKRSNIQDAALDDVISLSRRYPGVFQGVRSDGEWAEGKDGDNPLAQLVDGGTQVQKFNQLTGIFGLSVTPLEGLELSARFSPVFDFNEYDEFNTPPLVPRLGSTDQFWPQGQTNLAVNRTNMLTITTQALATYTKEVGDHHWGLLAGYEAFNTEYEQIATESRNLSVGLRSLEFGDPALTTNRQFASENGLRSFFGRITYDYQGKYLVQTNFRADGSTRFTPDERWGYFPSVSLGWVVSEENFMAGIPLLSFLKIRASYGEVGNERIGADRTGARRFFDFYPYQGLFEPFNTVLYQGGNFVAGPAVNQRFLQDRSLVWENTQTIDVGVDIGLFEDRVSLAVDYYQKQTDNILLELDIPNYLGYPLNTITNVGAMEVNGVDMGISYRNNVGDLRYTVNLNASVVGSEVTSVGGREDFTIDGGTKINIEGSEYAEWFGYETNGLWQSQEAIDEYGIIASPGDIRLVDQLTLDTDNDGIPDARDSVINEEDRVPLGASLPKFTYGGSVSLGYKGFDFSLAFNGVGKHTLRKAGLFVQPFDQGFGNIPSATLESYWSPSNTPAQNASAQYPRFSGVSEINNYAVSDYWLFNGSYLRIQNITLGYSLPQSIVERVQLQQLRVYVGLRDFFTIERNFLDGWDAEVQDAGAYPIMKTVLFGINVKL